MYMAKERNMNMRYDEMFEEQSLYRTMNEYKGRREARVALATAVILVFMGLALGVVLFRIVGDEITSETDFLVGDYFKGMFAEAQTLGDKLGVIVDSFFHELTFPLIVFAFGYTVYAPVFSAALCIWKSALCGFAICMLELTTMSGIFVESLIYLISQITVISICVSVAMRAFFYSRRFCSDEVFLSDIFKRADSRAYILDFVISAGVLFMTVTLTLVLINFIT